MDLRGILTGTGMAGMMEGTDDEGKDIVFSFSREAARKFCKRNEAADIKQWLKASLI